MSSAEHTLGTRKAKADPAEVLAQKRLMVYKAFLVLTLINNGFLALYCLAFGGGSFFAKAPAWSALTIGVLGGLTVLFSVAALMWKKWGIYGITGAGITAAVVSGIVQLLPAMTLFIVGTGFLLLIARHQWSRLQ